MAQQYASRMFISINGVPLVDVQQASFRQNRNARVVPTMTPDGNNRGFVEGNRDIDITVSIAVQNTLARPKLDFIDYGSNDVQLNMVFGADQFVATGLFLKDSDDNSPNVGEEVKTTFNFGALKVIDAVGNSVLFDLVTAA